MRSKKKIDMDTSSVREKDIYKTSRVMYVLEAAFEYFIAIVTSGAYLAKLTTSLGISDSMTAILTAITSLAGVFQMVSVFLAHKRPAKRWVIPSQLAPNLMFAFLYLIPFLNLKRGAALLFFVLMLSAWALKSVSTPVKLSCRIAIVDDKKRGQYYAILNIVSLVGSMAYTLFISSIIDKFDREENLIGAFIALTLIIFSLTVLHTLTLLLAKEKKIEVDKNQSTLKSIKHLFDKFSLERFMLILGASVLAVESLLDNYVFQVYTTFYYVIAFAICALLYDEVRVPKCAGLYVLDASELHKKYNYK